MSERISKQVIVIRKDLNMRKGKMVAQGSHASLGAYKIVLKQVEVKSPEGKKWKSAFEDWDSGTFTKICVGVENFDELMEVYGEALDAELPVKLITDAGHTEFHGEPTITCLAIGPVWSDEVDPITSHLKLL